MAFLLAVPAAVVAVVAAIAVALVAVAVAGSFVVHLFERQLFVWTTSDVDFFELIVVEHVLGDAG